MINDKSKIQMLVKVAKMYYLDNMNQNEIANEIGVSRPLISKYLSDAKELGIVKIQIHDLLEDEIDEIDVLKDMYGIEGGIIVPYSVNEDLMDQWLTDKTTSFFLNDIQEKVCNIGVGWG